MGNATTKKRVITPEFRVSFPTVFQPKLNTLNNKMEYSIQALFPKGEALEQLKALAREEILKKWPNGTPDNLRSPFRDQKDREKKDQQGNKFLPEGYVEGALYLNLRTEDKPGLVDGNMQPIITSSEFYPGCYAMASVSCYAYQKGVNCGVNFGLGNIQKTRDGEALSSRTRPEEDFAPIGGGATVAGMTDPFATKPAVASNVVDPFAVQK